MSSAACRDGWERQVGGNMMRPGQPVLHSVNIEPGVELFVGRWLRQFVVVVVVVVWRVLPRAAAVVYVFSSSGPLPPTTHPLTVSRPPSLLALSPSRSLCQSDCIDWLTGRLVAPCAAGRHFVVRLEEAARRCGGRRRSARGRVRIAAVVVRCSTASSRCSLVAGERRTWSSNNSAQTVSRCTTCMKSFIIVVIILFVHKQFRKTWQLTTHERDRQGWLSTHSGHSKEKQQQQLLRLYIYMWMFSDIRYTRIE